MRIVKKKSIQFICAAASVLALTLITVPANAGVFDFLQGRLAEPGTELYAQGNEALNAGTDGVLYFTNGEGRVVKVRAKQMPAGDLRVTSQRVYIPENYIAKTHDQTLEAERLYAKLAKLDGQQSRVGAYAVLPQDIGQTAFKFGEAVEAELKRNHQIEN